jgi:uncharacterized protein (TIGR04255 family)
MAEIRTLANAPVQEGLIDFRTSFDAPPDKRVFEAIAGDLKDRYPETHDIHRFEALFDLKEGKAAGNSSSQYAGLRFTSADKSFVFQAQVDGFTVSRLRPYSSWEDLLGEAQSLWGVFQRHARPLNVNRVATRYINRFEINAPTLNLDEYFATAPRVPADLPQGLSGYLVRLQIPDNASQSTILLTQAMEEATGTNAAFVVDIDIFKVAVFDVMSDEVWHLLGQFRDLKNRVFFSIMTEKTLELFK